MRKVAAIAILSTLTAVGAVAAAGTATALSSADYFGTITNNTWSYNGPSTEAAPVGSLQRARTSASGATSRATRPTAPTSG